MFLSMNTTLRSSVGQFYPWILQYTSQADVHIREQYVFQVGIIIYEHKSTLLKRIFLSRNSTLLKQVSLSTNSTLLKLVFLSTNTTIRSHDMLLYEYGQQNNSHGHPLGFACIQMSGVRITFACRAVADGIVKAATNAVDTPHSQAT